MRIFSIPMLIAILAIVSSGNLSQTGFAADLVIADNDEHTLNAGKYEYGTVKLGRNAKLKLNGSVTILCQKLESVEGATVEYVPNISRAAQAKKIVIMPLDASGTKYLKIVGNGAKGADKTGQAANGDNGRNGSWQHTSSPGRDGSQGENGGNGEHAADVLLYLQNFHPSGSVEIVTKGGDGGNGQKGGNGGSGGGGDTYRSASRGGHGGNGGNGGNAGSITVHLVANADMTLGSLENAKARIKSTPIIGTGGTGGSRGSGGNGGSPRGQIGGPRGARGNDGQEGTGGAKGKPADALTTVTIDSTYKSIYEREKEGAKK